MVYFGGTSLQYPSDFQKQRQKRENSMRPYNSRGLTENPLKSLENADFSVSDNFRVKAVNSVVFAISWKTQNPLMATSCGFESHHRHQKEKVAFATFSFCTFHFSLKKSGFYKGRDRGEEIRESVALLRKAFLITFRRQSKCFTMLEGHYFTSSTARYFIYFQRMCIYRH